MRSGIQSEASASLPSHRRAIVFISMPPESAFPATSIPSVPGNEARIH